MFVHISKGDANRENGEGPTEPPADGEQQRGANGKRNTPNNVTYLSLIIYA